MGMSLHPISAGNGWRYYMVETAANDESRSTRRPLAEYYAGSRNPPGVWEEHGAKALKLDRRMVAETAMHNLFQLGRHPETGHALGAAFPVYRSADKRATDRLAAEPDADKARRTQVHAEEQAKGEREAEAGYDLCFAPVKSVSVLWGIADDELRSTIEECHDRARRDALEWGLNQAIYTRRGRNGIAHAAVDSITTAVFMHRTSRTGDPHLHTHVVLSNKVRTADDHVWRAIHGELLFKAKVAMSERYNSRIETLLAERLGVEFVEAGRDIREVAGIPDELLRRFASRRVQVEARTSELLNEYRRAHGHDPDPDVEYRLAQQATLETRPKKKDGTTATSEREEWQATTHDTTGCDPAVLIAQVLGRHMRSSSRRDELRLTVDAVDETLASVQSRRAQWTVMHLRAEAERVVRRLDAPTAQHTALVDSVVDRVLGDPRVVALTPPSFVGEPDELRLPNGDPIWRTSTTHRYTTTAILQAEAALVDAARTAGAPSVPQRAIPYVLDQLAAEGSTLAVDQASAITALARSGRVLDLLIAPAGAGKSRTMHAMAATWAATTGRVIGLAPTARAARGLAESAHLSEINATAHTIDKWLTETARGNWALQPGDLVIVDEAGMASTPQLDALRQQVLDGDAKLLLVGDHRQLAAVGAGGALRHLFHEVGATELTTLWRFSDPWEAEVTVRLRDGDLEVIDEYLTHDRVHTGTASLLTDELYDAWQADIDGGNTSVMLAVSNRTVAQLNQRARRDRIAAGQVRDDDVITLADGTRVGEGDTVVTRKNRSDIKLFAGKDWVHNGDLWEVETVHDDGSLTVSHLRHGGRIQLPAEYGLAHVELGYASTVARAQGITVDTARVLVTHAGMDRPNLYVALTRGRHHNAAYLATRDEIDMTLDRPRRPDRGAWDMLAAILTNDAELSATEQLRAEQDTEWGLPSLAARYDHVCTELARPLMQAAVTAAVPAADAEAILAADGWNALAAQLRRLEFHGHDPTTVLRSAFSQRSLGDAVDPAAVLHHRILSRLGVEAAPGTYLGLSPAPVEDGPIGDWARDLHGHIREELANLLPIDLAQPWAIHLRDRHVPQDLVETIATWRALHDIHDDTRPLGLEPILVRNAPDHRQWLASQLHNARAERTCQDASDPGYDARDASKSEPNSALRERLAAAAHYASAKPTTSAVAPSGFVEGQDRAR
jgi:conjugative relaxase-like TrwC/TraI family protein